MPQDLLEIPIGDCGECIGGIAKVAVVDCGYIDLDATLVNSDRQITLIVASTPGKVVELVFDDDDTAKSDSVGERTNNIHRSAIATEMKFGCVTNEKLLAGDTIKKSCCLIAFIKWNNGMETVQGIDVVQNGVNWKAAYSKTKAKATVSALSDTGANEDRLEIKINSVSRNVLVPFADPATFGYDHASIL